MSYVGNVPTTAAFPFDQFSGNGSTTAFTLSYAPAGSTSIIVSISGVVQNPNTYSVSGTTITFSPAPPSGTNNIAVLYLGMPSIVGVPNYGTVSTETIANGAVTPAKLSSDAQYYGFKNRIINGAMVIDQRNAGASFSPTTTSGYTLDRWVVRLTQNSKLTVQQNAGSVTPPAGFTNYLGVTSSSAYSVLSTDVFTLAQAIEGFNTADLGFGTANAASVTLSFWVRSSLTGSFGGALINSASNRSYPFSYTISAANTWEQKTVTIAGDTSGTWLTNSSTGIEVRFGLGSGSNYTGTANVWGTANAAQPPSTVSVVGTNGATFYITGVQLEKGSTATSFDYRPYGTELALCQRYYYQSACALGSTSSDYEWLYSLNTGNQYRRNSIRHPVTMRAAPTVGSVTLRVNDASTVAGSSQYITNAYWAALYLAASGTDYVAINGYTVTAEL